MELGKTETGTARSSLGFCFSCALDPFAIRGTGIPELPPFPGKPQLSPDEPGDAGQGAVCCGAWDGDAGPLYPRHRAPLASIHRGRRWEHRARPVRSSRGGRHSRRAPRARRPGAPSAGAHAGRGGRRGTGERESHGTAPE